MKSLGIKWKVDEKIRAKNWADRIYSTFDLDVRSKVCDNISAFEDIKEGVHALVHGQLQAILKEDDNA